MCSFGIYNLDVRRLVPLAQLVVRQLRRLAAEHGGGKSLHDAKLLQFAQPFLAETCVRPNPLLLANDGFLLNPFSSAQWRASGFNALVLSLLAPCISSPFKQLREELSRTLVIIFCNLRFGAATAADATATVVAEAERFFSLPSLTATDPMEVEAEKGSSAEDTSHARETFLVVLSNAVRRAASAAIIPHAHRLIRLLFASFGDKDRVKRTIPALNAFSCSFPRLGPCWTNTQCARLSGHSERCQANSSACSTADRARRLFAVVVT